MGFHLYSLIHHMTTKARNDFMEMILHHGSTIFLYGLSYYFNRVESGALIMFLHDIADIPCSFARCYSETVFILPSLLSAVGMVVSWFYTRLIVFPQVIYYTYVDVSKGQYSTFLYFTSMMLVCLLILHYYWFYLLLTHFTRYLKKGKIDDM